MRALAAFIVLFVGCSKTTPPPPDGASPAPVIDAAAPTPTPAAAPDPLAVVLDGKAGSLPERATDFGKELDPGIRDKVAPARSGPVRQGPVSVDGGLPVEVVKRIARQNFGRFLVCYRKASATDPDLAGSMTITFTIDRTGATTNAARTGGTLASAPMTACVVASFGSLSFPEPELAVASHVVYGLEFEQE